MSRRGWWLFGTMGLLWGIPYMLIKVVDDGGVAPPVLVLTRVTIGAAILLPAAIRRHELTPLLAAWRWVVLFALIEIVVPWLLLSEAETKLASSISGLLIALVPILVAVIGRLTGGHDRLTPVRWAGLALGLGGVALLVAGGGSQADAVSVGEVLLVALCYAIGPLIAARKLGDLPSLGLTAGCLAFSAVLYAPLAAVSWPATVPSGTVLASLAGLAVACTAIAFALYFALIADAGPARASVITYVNPVVAVVLGILVLGEQLTATMVASFALVLAGSLLATQKTGSRVEPGGAGTARTAESTGSTSSAAGCEPENVARPAGLDSRA